MYGWPGNSFSQIENSLSKVLGIRSVLGFEFWGNLGIQWDHYIFRIRTNRFHYPLVQVSVHTCVYVCVHVWSGCYWMQDGGSGELVKCVPVVHPSTTSCHHPAINPLFTLQLCHWHNDLRATESWAFGLGQIHSKIYNKFFSQSFDLYPLEAQSHWFCPSAHLNSDLEILWVAILARVIRLFEHGDLPPSWLIFLGYKPLPFCLPFLISILVNCTRWTRSLIFSSHSTRGDLLWVASSWPSIC